MPMRRIRTVTALRFWIAAVESGQVRMNTQPVKTVQYDCQVRMNAQPVKTVQYECAPYNDRDQTLFMTR